jgi:hypothetical protein
VVQVYSYVEVEDFDKEELARRYGEHQSQCPMSKFTHLLTDLERKQIRAFIKADGEKVSAIRGLATRCRQNLPQIKQDLGLIQEFLEHYEQEVAIRKMLEKL